ncbi:MAG: AMP-dependent synthetase/ligase [Bifidobacteriaceae bacterium]|nr:AMP-dependent synthetase/ligase [Bifidobacteriaceae bacterium]
MLRQYTVKDIHPTTSKDTIYALLKNRVERTPDGIIAQYQDEKTHVWNDVTASQMLDKVHNVAKGLIGLGVSSGDKVVIYSVTSYEWAIVDFACATIGAISVPIYETDSQAQALEIAKDVNPVVMFAGDEKHARTFEQIRAEIKSLRYIFDFSKDGINTVEKIGSTVTDEQLHALSEKVQADDVLTIVYTSGSTGKPKGVMLTHRNFTHIIYAGYEVLDDMLYQPSRLLLFLPLAHCFARYIQYVAIGANGVVGYVSSTKRLLNDVRSFKPTYLLGVPRVFEKVFNAASQKAGNGFKGHIFAKAVQHFVQWSKDEADKKKHSVVEKIQHAFYMRTVGSSISSALGPKLKYLACGGAPMNADLAHFFNGIDGITFIQGYGMTETAAPCVVNFEDANTVGSVGRPGPGIAIRIADDGEVLIKGPNVFKGYYKQPELTREVLTEDGWLHSGDLGEINDNGFLFITGRKKDIIITAGGKNVSPAILEDVINTCPLVSHSVVIGDNKPFIAALVTLDPDMLQMWLTGEGIQEPMTLEQACTNERVQAEIQQYVDAANSHVSRAESVRKFVILPQDFNQDDGTLTPSMKVVRPKVLKQYEELINTQVYAPKTSTKEAKTTFMDKTSITVRNASREVTPKVRQAFDSAKNTVNEQVQKYTTLRTNAEKKSNEEDEN